MQVVHDLAVFIEVQQYDRVKSIFFQMACS